MLPSCFEAPLKDKKKEFKKDKKAKAQKKLQFFAFLLCFLFHFIHQKT